MLAFIVFLFMLTFIVALAGYIGWKAMKAPISAEPTFPFETQPSRDLARAKTMFFDYAAGSRFYMANDGCESEYLGFHVGKEQEAEWRREYISFWVGKLPSEKKEASHRLAAARAYEALPDMISAARTGDQWDQFWCAFEIYELAREQRLNESLNIQMDRKAPSHTIAFGIKTADLVWESIVKGPVIISQKNRARFQQDSRFHPGIYGDKTVEVYLWDYAKTMLARLAESGSMT
jgi:hypothetical protein